jgi:hypothetical protein
MECILLGSQGGADDSSVGAKLGNQDWHGCVQLRPKMFVKSSFKSRVENSAGATEASADHDGLRIEGVYQLGDGRTDGPAGAFENLARVGIAVKSA